MALRGSATEQQADTSTKTILGILGDLFRDKKNPIPQQKTPDIRQKIEKKKPEKNDPASPPSLADTTIDAVSTTNTEEPDITFTSFVDGFGESKKRIQTEMQNRKVTKTINTYNGLFAQINEAQQYANKKFTHDNEKIQYLFGAICVLYDEQVSKPTGSLKRYLTRSLTNEAFKDALSEIEEQLKSIEISKKSATDFYSQNKPQESVETEIGRPKKKEEPENEDDKDKMSALTDTMEGKEQDEKLTMDTNNGNTQSTYRIGT